MAFYVGKYLIQQEEIAPKHDRDAWAFPAIPKQHMAETSNVEDLYINPEDMDLVPEQIQFGFAAWTDNEGFSPDPAGYAQFYVRSEAFYVRSFTPATDIYSQFYVRDEAFYVRKFSPATELYKEFYVRQEAFYLRSFTAGTELYTQFYVKTQESFYVRSFTPTDWFYAIPEDC